MGPSCTSNKGGQSQVGSMNPSFRSKKGDQTKLGSMLCRARLRRTKGAEREAWQSIMPICEVDEVQTTWKRTGELAELMPE